ncbi:hypothetical protein [Jiella sp. M17.18]
MSQRIVVLTTLLAGVLMISACANTIRGAGRDVGNTVDATGQAVRNVAQ